MISVCLACYNGSEFITSQLESILVQLEEGDEVIVSDDGSSDGTVEIVKKICDKRIKIFHNTGPHNYTSNFENALLHANGDIIILSDQDDIWLDNKVSTIKKDLECYDFIVSDAVVVDSNLVPISDSFWKLRRPFFTAGGNLIRCGFLGCCMAFNRRVLDYALPFPQDHDKCLHDNWLLLIGAFFFKIKYESEPLILYRRHGHNASNAGLAKGKSLHGKLSYRLYLIYNLIKRRLSKSKV